jgi:hypothetical protein
MISKSSLIFPHRVMIRTHRRLKPFHVKRQNIACFPQGWTVEPGTMPSTPYAPTKTKGIVWFLSVDKAMLSQSLGVGSTPAVECNEIMQAPRSSFMPPRQVDLSVLLWSGMFVISFCRRTTLASCEVDARQ